ncbi:MAG TPA: CBS domain-containing protein [Rhodothermales bacterium]|nr:CBS domain-containing protein [Rhodothermales bacterium]
MLPPLPLVADVMRPVPHLVPAETPASEVAAYMHTERQRHVFVSDGDGHIAGLVNRARLLRHLVARRLADNLTPDLPIGELVVTDLIVIGEKASVADALCTMRRHHVGCLPVLDDAGRLVGLVSERLLLGAAEAVLHGH